MMILTVLSVISHALMVQCMRHSGELSQFCRNYFVFLKTHDCEVLDVWIDITVPLLCGIDSEE